MTPITRKEFYLAKIAGAQVTIPEPITNEEYYLARLCGADVAVPKPVTTDEYFLAKMCGEDVLLPYPETRLQRIWSAILKGESIAATPGTREELYWADFAENGFSTVTGSIVTFDTNWPVPLKSLSVTLSPIQSGTGDPSPDNVRPISGHSAVKVWRTGRNLVKTTLQSGSLNGVDYTVHEDGTISIDTGTASAYIGRDINNSVLLKGGVTYYLAGAPGNGCNILLYQNGSLAIDTGGGASYTPQNDIVVRVLLGVVGGIVANGQTFKPMLTACAPSTAFEPYSGLTIPITIPTPPGTVYGGTLDVVSGVLTVDKVALTIDGSTVKATQETKYGELNRVGIPYPSGLAPKYTGNTTYCLSDKLEPSFSKTIGATQSSTAGYFTFPHSSLLFVCLPYTDNSTKELANAWFAANMPKVVYELSTPVTYQLTPQEVLALQGQNVVFSDANGDVTVEYRSN